MDTKNHFHIDHVFPKSLFTKKKLKKADVPDEDAEAFTEMVNDLPNLQLLEGSENVEKLASMPADWIKKVLPTAAARTNYCSNHLLGDVPESLSEFGEFYNARRAALRNRISEMLAAKEGEETASEQEADVIGPK